MAHASNIRNVVFVGHGGSGKTSLTEAILFKAKALKEQGYVEKGTTASDFDDDEKEKKYSIDLSVMHVNWKEKKIQLLDSPGYADFSGAAVEGLSVAETAVFVINAAQGIEVNTRKLWRVATEMGIPRAIVISRLDVDNAKYDETFTQVQKTFGQGCRQVNLPVGLGKDFSGVVNLLNFGNVPDHIKSEAEKCGNELKETVMEVDDALLERYLEGQEIKDEEFSQAINQSIQSGSLIPVFATSVNKDIGITELLDFIVEYFPSPLEARERLVSRSGEEEFFTYQADGPFVGQVFKSVMDPFIGKLSFVRIFSGSLASNSTIYNATREKELKIGQISYVQEKIIA